MTLSWAQLQSFRFILTVDDFRRGVPECSRPSCPRITTITFQVNTGQTINNEKLQQVFAGNGTLNMSLMNHGRGEPMFKWRMTDSKFRNQVSLRLDDGASKKGKSVKVFEKGTVHVTGARDLFDCEMISTQITENILNKYNLVKIPIRQPADCKILMINANFNIGQGVDLKKLESHLRVYRENTFRPHFAPDVYAALSVKFYVQEEEDKEVTVSIFGSGKSIIAGSRTLRDLAAGYVMINEAISAAGEDVFGPSEAVPTRDMFMGYEVGPLCAELRGRGMTAWN